jgi:plastocyanin
MKNRIATLASLILLASIIIFSCSKSDSNKTNTPAPSNSVSIANMSFAPATITVSPGTTVTWTNNDNMTHTVTADDNSFDSGNLTSGSNYSRTFSVAGTYPYHCTIHPNMTAKVVVQ